MERDTHGPWPVFELAENPYRSVVTWPLEREPASVEVGECSRFGGRLGGEAGEDRPEQPACLAIRSGLHVEHEFLRFVRASCGDDAEHLVGEFIDRPV